MNMKNITNCVKGFLFAEIFLPCFMFQQRAFFSCTIVLKWIPCSGRKFLLCLTFEEFEFVVLNDPWHFLTQCFWQHQLAAVSMLLESTTPVQLLLPCFLFRVDIFNFYYTYKMFPAFVYQGNEILSDQCLCIEYSM